MRNSFKRINYNLRFFSETHLTFQRVEQLPLINKGKSIKFALMNYRI